MPKRGEVQTHRMIITEEDGRIGRTPGDLYYLIRAARQAIRSRRHTAPNSRLQIVTHPEGKVLLDWQGADEETGRDIVTLDDSLISEGYRVSSFQADPGEEG